MYEDTRRARYILEINLEVKRPTLSETSVVRARVGGGGGGGGGGVTPYI